VILRGQLILPVASKVRLGLPRELKLFVLTLGASLFSSPVEPMSLPNQKHVVPGLLISPIASAIGRTRIGIVIAFPNSCIRRFNVLPQILPLPSDAPDQSASTQRGDYHPFRCNDPNPFTSGTTPTIGY